LISLQNVDNKLVFNEVYSIEFKQKNHYLSLTFCIRSQERQAMLRTAHQGNERDQIPMMGKSSMYLA